MIAFDKSVTFQTRFMEGWEEFIDGLSARGGDTFWLDHQPAFHAYDYGANIKIEVNEEIANLEQETVIRSAHLHSEMDDDDDDDDGWEMLRQGREQHGEEEEEDGDGDGDGDQYPHPNAEDSLFLPMMIGRRRLEDEVGHDEEHDLPAAAGAGRIVMATSAPLSGGHSHRPEDEEEGGNGEVFGDDDEQEERFIRWMNESEGAVMTHSTGVAEAQQQQQGEEEGGLTHQHRSDGDEEEEEEDHHRGAPSSSSGQGEHDALYSDGLRRLREALEAKYNLDNISHVSYALAVDVHCTATSTHPGEGRGPAVCLLADRNRVAGEFYGSNYTFYPLGFHPAYGNFTSDRPPAFLDSDLFTVMKENMSHQNQGADVLSFGFFQGYPT
ncbi:hypothetical protein FSOLCH5_015455 [Fusarium solani]